MANPFLPLTILVLLSSLCRSHGHAHTHDNIVARSCSQFNVTEDVKATYVENYWKLIHEIDGEMGHNKFSIKEAGDPPNRIHVFSQCMNDLSASECRTCFKSMHDLLPSCLPAKGGRVYSDGCFMRIDNYSFYRETITPDDIRVCSDDKAQQAQEFIGLAINLINQMAMKAPDQGGFILMHGSLPSGLAIYGMASCWKTLDHDMCSACLANAASTSLSCLPSKEARVLNAGCVLSYADSSNGAKGRKDTFINRVAYALAATATCSLAIIVGYCAGKSIYKPHSLPSEHKGLEMNSLAVKRSLLIMQQFEYSTLHKATDGFNECQKLATGGYGEVYKGTLPDGREIAVKRFLVGGKQGIEAAYSEIDVHSITQHKNLVRALGCCFTSAESFMIYEFVANKSLNYTLFDPERKKHLDWPRSRGIIIGTAEGLEYLHSNFEVPIIHRDIKAGNILLDLKYRPRIADFGLANLKACDSIYIVGTLVYIAPEYLAGCPQTEKVDVYSFGVLVLEIVTGVESRKFEPAEETFETLVSHAWKHFQSNNISEIIDESMEGKDLEEITRVIQVGLLCAQELPYLRPSMKDVTKMLKQKDEVLPLPSRPPFTNDSLEFSHRVGSIRQPQHSNVSDFGHENL